MTEITKLRIMFVDDELSVIKSLKRTFRKYAKEWKMYFFTNPIEAFESLEKNEVDIIITDMKMPEETGFALLSKVKAKYPGIIRIILTGYADKKLIYSSFEVAHQLLIKPISAEAIISIVKQIKLINTYIENKELQKVVNDLSYLPPLPEIYLELSKKIKDPDSSLNDLAKIISRDPSLSADILKMVNSAYFGLSGKVYKISQAIGFMGIDLIKDIILTSAVFKNLKGSPTQIEMIKKIYNHSSNVLKFAMKICKNLDLDAIDKNYIFIASMFHDLGKIIMIMNMGRKYEVLLTSADKDKNVNIEDLEKKYLSITHSQVGAYILGLWGFSTKVIQTILFHHNPELSGCTNSCLLATIYLANYLDDLKNSNFQSELKKDYLQKTFGDIDIDELVEKVRSEDE